MKKISAIVMALIMLMQTVASASLLSDLVTTAYPTYCDNNLFSYTKFNQTLNQEPEKVAPAVMATVCVAGQNNYAEHNSAHTSVLSSSTPNFDFRVELDMTNVKAAFSNLYTLTKDFVIPEHATSDANRIALENNFVNSEVVGEFDVVVKYDTRLSFDAPTTSNVVLTQKEAVGEAFGTPRNFEIVSVTSTGADEFTVKFKVKKDSPTDPLTIGDIQSDPTRLNNLAVIIPNVTATVSNTVLAVETTMTGKTTFADPADYTNLAGTTFTDYGFVEYDSDDTHNKSEVRYTVSTGGGSGLSSPKAFTSVDGVVTEIEVQRDGGKRVVDVDELEGPAKEGYIFDGWYLDKEMTELVTGVVEIDKDTYFYGGYVAPGDSKPIVIAVVGDKQYRIRLRVENGKYVLDTDDVFDPALSGLVFDGWYDTPYYKSKLDGEYVIDGVTYIYANFKNTTPPTQLISDDHMLYIVGYPDGEVKPQGLITREEVVAALYRLLKDDYRRQIESNEQVFPDVEADRWSFNDISTMYKGGYVAGYDDGMFYPAKPITRAEFVTIIHNFAPMEVNSYAKFSDIEGHWAEKYIEKSAGLSWVTGYEDGTFRPNQPITRAEAMTIINSMLVRYADVDSELAHKWPDLAKTDWYYGAVVEATTSHTFERAADGWNEIWHAEGKENPALTNDPFFEELVESGKYNN